MRLPASVPFLLALALSTQAAARVHSPAPNLFHVNWMMPPTLGAEILSRALPAPSHPFQPPAA